MQLKTAILSLFAVAVAAQSIDDLKNQIPQCARQCLDDASTKAGCAAGDANCQCQPDKLADITQNALPCVALGCSSEDQGTTASVSQDICAAVAQQAGNGAFSSAINSATSSLGSLVPSATNTDSLPTPTPTDNAAADNHRAGGIGLAGAAAMLALAL